MAGRPKRRARLEAQSLLTTSTGGQSRLAWQAAPRFIREYERASGPLQALVQGEVQYLRRRAKSQADWAGEYQPVRGLPRNMRVLELELGGGPRAFAHLDAAAVTLLSMGAHESTQLLKRMDITGSLAAATALPDAFGPGHVNDFFPSMKAAPAGLARFAAEADPEWLYFLDEQQATLCDEITDAIEDTLLADTGHYQVHFVLGGPGTGKTSILLQLLMRLSETGGGRDTWDVGLNISDEVASYIDAATGWDLQRCRAVAENYAEAQVLLLDDPHSLISIRRALDIAGTASRLQAVVVAFDPLQLVDSLSDEDYEALRVAANAHEWRLSACYRQKEEVGRVTLRVAHAIADSSPFLDDQKKSRYAGQRAQLTQLSNGLQFRNPTGHAFTVEEATKKDWDAHIAWITSLPGLWRHWPPLLIVVDPLTEFPAKWRSALTDLPHREIALSDVQSVKGLEYQHVAVVLSAQRHRDLQDGFSGSGQRLYNTYRLLRIPFSRAKDSMGVFVPNGC